MWRGMTIGAVGKGKVQKERERTMVRQEKKVFCKIGVISEGLICDEFSEGLICDEFSEEVAGRPRVSEISASKEMRSTF